MMSVNESVERIEPARLETVSESIADAVAELSAVAAALEAALHPRTAEGLADHVRIMNCFYSNLIEGHNPRPRDIARALAGKLAADKERRDLQLEARAHIRVQREIDRLHDAGELPEPASSDFIRWLHREFYRDAPKEMLRINGQRRSFIMKPGEFRSKPEHDVDVGQHVPPASERVAAFMAYFETRYRLKNMGKGARILSIPAAHHRLAYIHPFPDGNGRVSRLVSHAMALKGGIGAHGLWSVSRGLARGLKDRSEYKAMMAHADMPRQGDLDGRGNLSERALAEFTLWFLRVCIDQVRFMSSLFATETLAARLRNYVVNLGLCDEAARLAEEALLRGEFERGAAPRIIGLGERTTRDLLQRMIRMKLLGSNTARGPVSLRFPDNALETLFPKLYPEA